MITSILSTAIALRIAPSTMPPSSSLIACHECDVLQRAAPLPEGGVARCIRCGALLYRCPHDGLNRTLALEFGAVLLFMLTNIYPLMTLEARGGISTATLLDTVLGLYNQGRPLVASLVLVTAIGVPVTHMAGMIYLLLPLRLGWVPRGFRVVFRVLQAIRPWGMTGVFMLAALVSLAKLSNVADVTPGAGLWAFGGLMLTLTASTASFECRHVWERVEAIGRANRFTYTRVWKPVVK